MLNCLKNKTAEWDCTQQMEDVIICDWILGRHPEYEESAKYLMDKQCKDDKNILRRFVWWLTRDKPFREKIVDKLIEVDKRQFDNFGK